MLQLIDLEMEPMELIDVSESKPVDKKDCDRIPDNAWISQRFDKWKSGFNDAVRVKTKLQVDASTKGEDYFTGYQLNLGILCWKVCAVSKCLSSYRLIARSD